MEVFPVKIIVLFRKRIENNAEPIAIGSTPYTGRAVTSATKL
jgi:hypothetical protein